MSRFFHFLAPLALGVCAFSSAPRADEADTSRSAQTAAALKSILSDTEIPLSIMLKDMDAGWRRFVVNGAGNDATMQIWGAMAGLEFGVHFTQGHTVMMGDDTFLIAYRLPVNIDRRFLNWHGHGEAPRPRKPTDKTVLNLSLLNLRTINGLNDLRAFKAETDMESVEQSNAASVRTLTQLGQGVMRFIRARGTFPTLDNPIDWNAKRSFYPYVGDERLFMHPGTQEMYRYNTILSGKKAIHISQKQLFVVFYEAEAGGDGTRGVLFMDGHVERLSPARWEKIKKVSKISDDENGDGDEEFADAPTTIVVVNATAPSTTITTTTKTNVTVNN